MMVRLGRKPRTDRWRSGFFFKLKNRPRIAATICPVTVASAAPATSILGKPNRPKIMMGSRMMLMMAPVAWVNMV